jgi:hypothetical protein
MMGHKTRFVFWLGWQSAWRAWYRAGEGGVLMSDQSEDLVARLQREELERLRANPSKPPRPPEPPSIHYTQLPDAPPESPITSEWNFFRRVVGRLLAEGHEGKWLLVKYEDIVGIWATEAEADAVRQERFPAQPVLMKQILFWEPVLRSGYNRLRSA